MPKPNDKVRILRRCDGSNANAGIVISGSDSGSLVRRMDGTEMNCCPLELQFIWTGVGVNPVTPHANCVLNYDFLNEDYSAQTK